MFGRVISEMRVTISRCDITTETDIAEREVARLSRYLGLTPKQFIAQYTTMSAQEDDEIILRRNDAGCIFLDGNDCTIYEARPDTCKLFPHLVRGAGSIESRMWQMIDRASTGPSISSVPLSPN